LRTPGCRICRYRMRSETGTGDPTMGQPFKTSLRAERVRKCLWYTVVCALAAAWLWGAVAAIVSAVA